jgi:hypothetical protein
MMRDDFQIYSKLSWNITVTFLLSISFFYILISERARPESCILGLVLTAFSVYSLSSIRLKKHQALLEALRFREIRPFRRPNLNLWYPTMFMNWLFGLLWCFELSKSFVPWIPFFIFFLELWTIFVSYFAVYFNDRIQVLKNLDKY